LDNRPAKVCASGTSTIQTQKDEQKYQSTRAFQKSDLNLVLLLTRLDAGLQGLQDLNAGLVLLLHISRLAGIHHGYNLPSSVDREFRRFPLFSKFFLARELAPPG
jgi:hypothetical protein